MSTFLSRQLRHVMEQAASSPSVLYHVTFLSSLPSIQMRGLKPTSTSNFLQGMDAHSKGRVFFTSEGGLDIWFHKLEQVAFHGSDRPLDDGLIPVALRVSSRSLELKKDKEGTRDARAEAWFVESSISPADLEVWMNGWKPLSSVDVADMREIAEQAAEVEQWDGQQFREPDYRVFFPSRG